MHADYRIFPLSLTTALTIARGGGGALLIGARSQVARNVYARVRDAAKACMHGCDSRKQFGLYQESALSRLPC